MQNKEQRTCPICGKTYHDHPALSRTDGRTEICPDCGTRQALEAVGIPAEKQEKILEVIHEKLRVTDDKNSCR
jgi:predicted nucleic-acid-binding Zn-ribbon protein